MGFMGTQQISNYLQLYKFLLVLSEEQITKLRKIAVGMLELSAFSKEEIQMLEYKMQQQSTTVH
jgi:hypothetical protein